MRLPIFQDPNQNFMLHQTKWAQLLEPVLASELSNGNFLESVKLINGATAINHLLGRKPQGWIITDQTGAASIYRSQSFNPLTLTLTSNAAVTVNLFVF